MTAFSLPLNRFSGYIGALFIVKFKKKIIFILKQDSLSNEKGAFSRDQRSPFLSFT